MMHPLSRPTTLVIQQSCLRALHANRVCTLSGLQALLCSWGMLVTRCTLLRAMAALELDGTRNWAVRNIRDPRGSSDMDVIYACNTGMFYPLRRGPLSLFGPDVIFGSCGVHPPCTTCTLPGGRTQLGPEWDLGMAIDFTHPVVRKEMKVVVKDLQRGAPWQGIYRPQATEALSRICDVLRIPKDSWPQPVQ